jgi:hypothetical protein
MLVPIEGANNDYSNPTGQQIWPARSSLESEGSVLNYIASMSIGVQGPSQFLARLVLEVGNRRTDWATLALQIGSSQGVVTAAQGLMQIAGPSVRAAALALSVSEARPSLAYPALVRVEVTSSKNIASAALLAAMVRTQSTYQARVAAEVRGRPDYAGMLALEVHNGFQVVAPLDFIIGSTLEARALLSAQIRNADSFLILADVIEADLQSLETLTGFFPAQFINASLTVNGTDVPIKAFTYSEADGKLGSVLNVTLARPILAQVPIGAAIVFKIIVRNAAGVWKGRTLISSKVGSRGINISYRGGENGGPVDEVVFSSVDILQDKFSLAPRRTITMYDPTRVALSEVATRLAETPIDENGNFILPVLEPVVGLTLRSALGRAYTKYGGGTYTTALNPVTQANVIEVARIYGGGPSYADVGLGFDAVITNIPNYNVSRADFTLEGGFHDGVQPLISMFAPMFFVFGPYLHILDIEAVLPAGYTPYNVPIEKYKSLALDTPYKDLRNAALLTYMIQDWASLIGLSIVEEFVQNTDKPGPGQFGDVGYTEIYTEDKWRRYYRFGELIAEFNLSHKVETRTTYQNNDGTAGFLMLIHREFQQDFYTGSLKTGHDKSIEGIIAEGPIGSLDLQELEREKCSITWAADPNNPGTMVQSLTIIQTEGLVYSASDTKTIQTPEGEAEVTIRYPALVAQASGVVADDGSFDWRMVRTVTERLRAGKGNQVDVETVTIDHLNNTIIRTTSQPRIGSRAESTIKGLQRHMLFRDLASEAEIGPRIPIGFNTGEVPPSIAFMLARRQLYRGTHPLSTTRLNLPGVDFAVGKGSVVRGQQRDGTYSGKYIIVGLTITGQDLGQAGKHRIAMALEGAELPT